MNAAFADDLEAALETRPVIEQAKGVLIGLRGDTPDQAFDELRHASQTYNIKLHTLAAGLVEAAAGARVSDAAAEEAVVAQWGRFLTRYPAIRGVEDQESA